MCQARNSRSGFFTTLNTFMSTREGQDRPLTKNPISNPKKGGGGGRPFSRELEMKRKRRTSVGRNSNKRGGVVRKKSLRDSKNSNDIKGERNGRWPKGKKT